MKILIIYILFILLCVDSACTSQTAKFDTEVVLLIDQTDSLTVYPDAEDISAQLGLKDNSWQSIRIAVTSISDRDINATAFITLEKENEWGTNISIRQAKVERFKKQLKLVLATLKNDGACPRSIIYRAIANKANELSQSAATNKYLVVYSNLFENSEVNFYQSQAIEQLRNNPQRMEKQLAATAQLNTLGGVQVFLTYTPASYAENNKYMIIARFYKHLFEAHGAVTRIDNKFQLQ